MSLLTNKLLNDENGFLVSAELVLVFTLMFCGVVVGMAVIRDSLAQEMGDVAEAIGALNQSYQYGGLVAPTSTAGTNHSNCSGAGFSDQSDLCDCNPIQLDFVSVNIKDDPNNSATTAAGEGT